VISWAVPDSGIRANHQMSARNPIEKRYADFELNLVPEDEHDDLDRQGTHVARIILSDSTPRQDM
jgi:hypothetical protein